MVYIAMLNKSKGVWKALKVDTVWPSATKSHAEHWSSGIPDIEPLSFVFCNQGKHDVAQCWSICSWCHGVSFPKLI